LEKAGLARFIPAVKATQDNLELQIVELQAKLEAAESQNASLKLAAKTTQNGSSNSARVEKLTESFKWVATTLKKCDHLQCAMSLARAFCQGYPEERAAQSDLVLAERAFGNIQKVYKFVRLQNEALQKLHKLSL
jgi:multidrug resistance efflux pump